MAEPLAIQCSKSPKDGLHCDHNLGALTIKDGAAEGATACCWCGRTERYKFFVTAHVPIPHGEFKPGAHYG